MALTKVTTGIIADSAVTTTQITDATIVTADIAASTIATSNMAVDPTNASNLSSGSVPLAQLGNVDTSGIDSNKEDIALLAFKTQANGSLARYNLVDQSVDSFEDASGVNAPASTDAIRNVAGKYYSGVGAETEAFTANGTWTVPAGVTLIDVLVVAGGGGGGSTTAQSGRGGAGGAGGLIFIPDWDVTGSATYAVVVGAGGGMGAGGNNSNGALGINSTVIGGSKTLTALGGGGGGQGDSNNNQTAGGSGGGGWYPGYPAAAGNQPSTTNDGVTSYPSTGFGNNSGVSGNASPYGAGGGGAGGAGAPYSAGPGPTGGLGKDYSAVFGTGYGDAGLFAGGGSGSNHNTNSNFAAVAGGGVGDNTANNTGYAGGNDGKPNTGGGAGAGGSGGSGVVLFSREVGENMILVSETITAQAAPNKGDLVFTYTNGAGTAVLGTNITAEFSADAGSTWTDFGISASDSQGTTGGHTIVTKNNVTLTSTSGTNMRYRIKTLVQSVSMDSRIHAVSLGWS